MSSILYQYLLALPAVPPDDWLPMMSRVNGCLSFRDAGTLARVREHWHEIFGDIP
jgi:hypothetical protein